MGQTGARSEPAPKSLGVTLVTNNEADFRGFAGLVVENWGSNH